jgi:hypothetical protein
MTLLRRTVATCGWLLVVISAPLQGAHHFNAWGTFHPKTIALLGLLAFRTHAIFQFFDSHLAEDLLVSLSGLSTIICCLAIVSCLLDLVIVRADRSETKRSWLSLLTLLGWIPPILENAVTSGLRFDLGYFVFAAGCTTIGLASTRFWGRGQRLNKTI